jgi:putative ABC transport system ATP-binding protein
VPTPNPDAAVSAGPVAELRDVHKVYERGSAAVTALGGLSLTVRAGDHLAVMGPSGSGKSTLLAILGCLDRPSAGSYLLDGEDTSTLDDARLSRVRNRRIGFVFQSFHLLGDMSVLENVETPLLYSGTGQAQGRLRARECLERVGLAHRIDHRPGELSGGEAQRAAIARALVCEPSLILADEPTGNLDSATGEDVARLLDDLHLEGRTIVLVTHNERLAARAKRIVHLRDGRIERED